MLCVIVIAGFEAMPPFGGDSIIIVGMDDPTPAELILDVRSMNFPAASADHAWPGMLSIICSARFASESVSPGELDAVVIGYSSGTKKAWGTICG
jgi:hypothetical protein